MLSVFEGCLLSVLVCVARCVYIQCVCMPIGNAGPGDRELQQPRFYLPDPVTPNKEFNIIPIKLNKEQFFHLLFHLLAVLMSSSSSEEALNASGPYPSSSTTFTVLESSLIFLLSHLFGRTAEF